MNTAMRPPSGPAAGTMLALSLFLLLSAFRHTDIETQTNPGFAGYRFAAVYVQLPTSNDFFREYIAKRLAREFRKSKVRMYTADDLFSPFRDWSDEERTAVLIEHGVTATMVISLESGSERASNGVVFFNTDLGTATRVQAKSDRSVFHVRLIDLATRDLAWTAILRTRGNGSLFTGDKSTAKAVSKHVAKSLRTSGHLLK